MSAPMGCQLIGTWRINGSDQGAVDVDRPACLIFKDKGWGELASIP